MNALPDDAERPRLGRRPSTTHGELETVAIGLFVDQGFDQTSIDEIAAAAGIARRTFFRYYPSKTDLVWGNFDGELERLATWFDSVPAEVTLVEAVRQAVIEFNRLAPGNVAHHRRRLGLILGVPTLLANSTLRFAEWRAVIAGFAADRLGQKSDELLPNVIAYSALGATLAGYERWLADEEADLSEVLDDALGALASGFVAPSQ